MITPNWNPRAKQLRQFAAAGLVGFGLVGWMFWHKVHSPTGAYIFWTIGALTFVVGMATPEAIRPLYALLMAVTLPIGWLVSAIFLRIIFYIFLTPIGLIFRALGRDPLRLRKPSGTSFWIDHRDRPDIESYFRQA